LRNTVNQSHKTAENGRARSRRPSYAMNRGQF